MCLGTPCNKGAVRTVGAGSDAGCESRHRGAQTAKSPIFTCPRAGKGWAENAPAPAPSGRGWECVGRWGGCRAGRLRWAAVCSHVISGHRAGQFPEPLRRQGASSSSLVLRRKAPKTISHALWGPASFGKDGLRKWLLSH